VILCYYSLDGSPLRGVALLDVYIVTLKSRLEVIQGHSKWYQPNVWIWFPVRIP